MISHNMIQLCACKKKEAQKSKISCSISSNWYHNSNTHLTGHHLTEISRIVTPMQWAWLIWYTSRSKSNRLTQYSMYSVSAIRTIAMTTAVKILKTSLELIKYLSAQVVSWYWVNLRMTTYRKRRQKTSGKVSSLDSLPNPAATCSKDMESKQQGRF